MVDGEWGSKKERPEGSRSGTNGGQAQKNAQRSEWRSMTGVG